MEFDRAWYPCGWSPWYRGIFPKRKPKARDYTLPACVKLGEEYRARTTASEALAITCVVVARAIGWFSAGPRDQVDRALKKAIQPRKNSLSKRRSMVLMSVL
jgi:hypothetical protein